MIKSKGILYFDPSNISKKHHKQSSWKRIAVIKLNDDTDIYYSWLLKKRFNLELNRSIRGSHITIISDIVGSEIWEQAKSIFNGKDINFQYDISPRSNSEHWWLKVESKDAESIRSSMGLNPIPYFNFHLTMGYAADRLDNNGNSMGGSNLEHSKYILRQCIKFNI